MEQRLAIADLKGWIRADDNIEITPLNQRHEDLEFGIPPSQLFEIVRAIEKYSRSIFAVVHYGDKSLKQFFLDFGINERQLKRINSISLNILRRSLYGVLFLKDGKFFSKLSVGKRFRRTITISSTLKPDGNLENPWEAVVYATKKYIEYRNSDDDDWHLFDMDKHIDDNERSHYLECLVKYPSPTELVQYTGLFIIRLNPNIQIRIAETLSNSVLGGWLPINTKYNQRKFYKLNPFIQYLQQHPDFA
ncbi:unnamed protein product [Rotaria magnacalcarata]|uniref:Uncharacterized protein n=1 Tax=Rotaria magnacalcarata TaxID=392030 RepID=A0A816H2S7_9BILA|nr:unnamed protein product [Rotaria magnacalcarata]